MEQISFFLAEYSDWVGVAFGLLATFLLTVTLHRIKKLGKRMDSLARSMRSERVVWEDFDEAENEKHMTEERTADVKSMDRKSPAEGNMSVRPNTGKASTGEPKREMNPDELLNAVLDEVFP